MKITKLIDDLWHSTIPWLVSMVIIILASKFGGAIGSLTWGESIIISVIVVCYFRNRREIKKIHNSYPTQTPGETEK